MTLSRQEIDHPTSSSSSSSSPTVTSSTEIDHSDHHPAIVSSERVERQVRRDPYSSEKSEKLLNKPTKISKPNKNENHEPVRGDPCHSDIPEWLQEFRETLVDDSVPERRDSHASSSHGSPVEPACLYSIPERPKLRDLPEDQNHKAPCRRGIGRVVPRAENFGDLFTADHKVLSERCESRNNHRYAVVVQATQWIQSYPCKT